MAGVARVAGEGMPGGDVAILRMGAEGIAARTAASIIGHVIRRGTTLLPTAFPERIQLTGQPSRFAGDGR